jgi:predicted RND superfamily exporter protein
MTTFFGRPLRLFGNVSVLILCVVFFLTPFSLRGARMSLMRMENNVKDWLPSYFAETKELEWFGKHFVGERFVLVTWPGCTVLDDRYQLLVRKLQTEVAVDDELALELLKDGNTEAELAQAAERLRVRKVADRYGLFATGDFYENWGGLGERWLLGQDGWHYITPDGGLYRWDGKSNLPGAIARSIYRLVYGTNRAEGELITQLGGASSRPNEFFADPRKVTARFFKTVETGPELVEQLAVEGGALWPRLSDVADEEKPMVARRAALNRLTGTLFGPAVQPGFSWKPEAFLDLLPEETRHALPGDWQTQVESFVVRLVEREYDGDREQLLAASVERQSEYWEDLFVELAVESPPRQTSIVVTLSEVGKADLAKVIGRPIMGKPPGKLIDLAINECGIPLDVLKLGGPPVDNVAIDEEGTITLFRLIGWCAVIGLGLAYLCFRSIKVTTMVFFVGGVSAVTSLSIVWWGGASVDAVLMTMPSLVYVLGLSGAVHIVNYYREAAQSDGLVGAADRALAHGWGPCTLAAFTTALGLISLYSSNLAPIKKFGLFSAIGVMLTLTLMFTYLPAALQIWPPGYHLRRNRENAGESLTRWVESFWVSVGRWIIQRHGLVASACLIGVVLFGLGLQKTDTSVQLLKLFDSDAKIIRDYGWLEDNFGKLVPMELVVRVRPEMIQPPYAELPDATDEEKDLARYQLNLLERMELTAHVQEWVEYVFGEDGQGIVGQGLSSATFAPDLPAPSFPTILNPLRWGFNNELEESRKEILASDYLRIDTAEGQVGSELWRVSLRVGALNDVDYGEFIHEQKLVVEPVLKAYQKRTELLNSISQLRGEDGFVGARVGVIGISKPHTPPKMIADEPAENDADDKIAAAERRIEAIDQTYIFASTLQDLLTVAGCNHQWIDPNSSGVPDNYFTSEQFAAGLRSFDVVVLIDDAPDLDLEFVGQHAKSVFDARDHRFQLGGTDQVAAADPQSAVQVVYTGVVPVVYKAQRTLLNSLIYSIGLAFVMIAIVMMILLRDWKRRPGLTNIVNVPAGAISMIPNLFPVIVIFGFMGHQEILIDIGTMMCASVAMGVAVDDTIHYLTWFRHGIRSGMSRNEAILSAYRRVATAMTQTTLIGGLGLSVFAFSTFTPTQRFGVMMVALLVAALVGDLVLLPALLAGPLGRFFCPKSASLADPPASRLEVAADNSASSSPTPIHAPGPAPHSRVAHFRADAARRRER